VVGSSLVMDARNKIANHFLDHTNADYLIFIDGDISWEPGDITHLVRTGYNVIAGVYPKKKLESESSVHGLIDESLLSLDDKVSETIYRVKSTGAGFLLIKRDVLERFRAHYIDLQYKDDDDQLLTLFFDTHLVGRSHYGEDAYFCYLLNSMGESVYVDTSVQLGHEGSYIYRSAKQKT